MSTTTRINLGTQDRLTVLFSYPNFAGDKKSLADTILHWFGQTLVRDGYAAATATVSIGADGSYSLVLTGPDTLASAFAGYADRFPKFLDNGWAAWTDVVPALKKNGRWDPCPDQPLSTYLPWRFFLPLGMPMLNQKALLFFHYPPIRLLETNQDYLDDPVPVRCEELLAANGVTSQPGNLASGDIMLFNTVMDATPIGAEDDQGSKTQQQCTADGCPATAYDPTFGLIPIQCFHTYQKAQVALLLNKSAVAGYTAPIVIYGAHPLQTFNTLYGTNLKSYQTAVVQDIIPGLKTPVLASTHPYVFYGQAQGFDKIGSGIMPAANVPAATAQMIKDLAVARWLKAMSDDPSQDPAKTFADSLAWWKAPAQTTLLTALVNHQGSLWYYKLPALDFKFKVPCPSFPSPSLASMTAKASAPASPPAPKVKAAGKAVSNTAAGLQVLGDDGTPVDWWFMYKISRDSKPTGSAKATATGAEYVYFDAAMAKAGKEPFLSKNQIDKAGPLFTAYSQLFTAQAKANKDLGYICYNDEDRLVNGEGSGPDTKLWGHCKGVLAFDLATDTAFWLIHSIPLLPMNAAWAYPPTGFKEAQSLIGIQLPNVAATKDIAQLIYDAHGPNVLVASDMLTKAHDKKNNFTNPPVTNVPGKLGMNDPRVLLMQDKNGSQGSSPQPVGKRIVFTSKAGQQFTAIAKNRAWGNPVFDKSVTGPGQKDFYDDLVAATLSENLDVETWVEGASPEPPSTEDGHNVIDRAGVDLSKINIPWTWTELVDHAKLAISDPDNKDTNRWVCVGDINFTDSMEARGGGTVAFQCQPLWDFLNTVFIRGNVKAKAPAAKKPAAKKPAAKKPIAKKPVTKTASAKKAPARKKAVKQPAKKKPATKKKAPSGKKTAVKKAPAKKTASKKAPSKKTSKKAALKKPAAKAVKKKAAKKAGKKR